MKSSFPEYFYGNHLSAWAFGLSAAVVTYFVLQLAKRIIVRRAGRITKRTETRVDDIAVDLISHVKPFFPLALGIETGSYFLHFTPLVATILKDIVVIAVVLQVALWASRLLVVMLTRSRRGAEGEESTLGAYSILVVLGRVSLWSLALLLILDNLGVNVTALIAGLGIGGIAIALALQSVLGDIFASLSILLDKPFVVGDTISVDTFTGTIERIGLKTTRLRSLTGEQLVFSNADLTRSRIRNFTRTQERRVVTVFCIALDTPADVLERLPAVAQAVVEDTQYVRFVRAHLRDVSTTAVNLELVYDVISPDYIIHMDAQQHILISFHRELDRLNATFAYAYPQSRPV